MANIILEDEKLNAGKTVKRLEKVNKRNADLTGRNKVLCIYKLNHFLCRKSQNLQKKVGETLLELITELAKSQDSKSL